MAIVCATSTTSIAFSIKGQSSNSIHVTSALSEFRNSLANDLASFVLRIPQINLLRDALLYAGRTISPAIGILENPQTYLIYLTVVEKLQVDDLEKLYHIFKAAYGERMKPTFPVPMTGMKCSRGIGTAFFESFGGSTSP